MKKSPTTVTKKQGWGGKRAGSGRKPGPYAGTSKVTTIVLTAALIEKLHKLGGSSWVREQIIKSKDDLLPAEKPESLASLTSIGSYFNSTEEDPLSACLVRNPEETVFCIAEDDTMKDSGIDFGDLLIVDRSADPQNGSMVVVHTADGYSIRSFYPLPKFHRVNRIYSLALTVIGGCSVSSFMWLKIFKAQSTLLPLRKRLPSDF